MGALAAPCVPRAQARRRGEASPSNEAQQGTGGSLPGRLLGLRSSYSAGSPGRMGKKIKKEVEPPPKDVFDPLMIESKKAATVVLMLRSPEEEILAKACEAIYKFALKGEENKTTLLELGAVEPLTKLLTHEDKIVRRNATMIFGILASNTKHKHEFFPSFPAYPPLAIFPGPRVMTVRPPYSMSSRDLWYECVQGQL
ncbi:hypothetical protein H8959_011665 [Pygathrix nigripes]